MAAGAQWCSGVIEDLDIKSLLVSNSNHTPSSQNDLFSQPQADLFSRSVDVSEKENKESTQFEEQPEQELVTEKVASEEPKAPTLAEATPTVVSKESFYQLFVQYLAIAAREPISEAELVETSQLHKGR